MHTSNGGGPVSASADSIAGLGDELLATILRLKRLGARVLDHWQVDVTMSELAVLGRLSHSGPQRLSALAEWSQLDPSSASRQIADLVDHGYLERLDDPDDGRARLLTLTASGHDLLARIVSKRNEFFGDALRGWTDSDVARLHVLLHRLNADVGDSVSGEPASPHAVDRQSAPAGT